MQPKFKQGEKVYYPYDGTFGIFTGRFRESPRGVLLEIKFESGITKFVLQQDLEPAVEQENICARFSHGSFGSISDFKRTIFQYRLSGELTNLMYSMNNTKTDFLAHQFIPVTKFLESNEERLLIADEVGLGKTIEAMYIWEEIKARYNAHRLLIVAPAVLRGKWKNDIAKYFDIDAQIVSAQNGEESLCATLTRIIENRQSKQFALIVSLEGIRVADRTRAIFEQNADTQKLFDLVIIDEAHNLKNAQTESFQTAEQLRDVASRILLLSATPIQTGSDNFYNLLHLLQPEEFAEKSIFEARLNENKSLVRLSNALENFPNSTADDIKERLKDVLSNIVFAADSDCKYLKNHLDEVVGNVEKRIEFISKLKDKFFYSHYLTRTRKRDVIEGRTIRDVHTVDFKLSRCEKDFYDKVTSYLRKQKTNGDGFAVFRLIARQRQMTSCMAGALEQWREVAPISVSEHNDTDDDNAVLADIQSDDISSVTLCKMPTFPGVDLSELKRNDSKFNLLQKTLNDLLTSNPHEKIIIFSFFRHTVKYLKERLNNTGIKADLMMGGISPEEKNAVIENFRNGNFNVLVSSEVGAEGIDLQFARYEINYDLPWNPMRLEQRIGRIDRIGQKSPKIFIYNMFCETTVEDRILFKLYERIEKFRDVIGDLEEILGKVVSDIEVDVFNNGEMSQEEIDALAQQLEITIANKERLNIELARSSGNLTAYQEFVLNNISRAHDNLRHITPEELRFTVKDYLNSRFPGSSVTDDDCAGIVKIRLSPTACRQFSQFLAVNPGFPVTSLTYTGGETVCTFGPIPPSWTGVRPERIDIAHALIKWILENLKAENPEVSCCPALEISMSDIPAGLSIPRGMYSFYIQEWMTNGFKKRNELHYFAVDITGENMLDESTSERLLMAALQQGTDLYVNQITEECLAQACLALERATQIAWQSFDSMVEQVESQNENLVEEQKKYIVRTHNIRIANIEKQINDLTVNGKSESVLRMNKARRDHAIARNQAILDSLEIRKKVDTSCAEVAVGIIEVK